LRWIDRDFDATRETRAGSRCCRVTGDTSKQALDVVVKHVEAVGWVLSHALHCRVTGVRLTADAGRTMFELTLMAGSVRSRCVPKAVCGKPGACRQRLLSGSVTNSRSRPSGSVRAPPDEGQQPAEDRPLAAPRRRQPSTHTGRVPAAKADLAGASGSPNGYCVTPRTHAAGFGKGPKPACLENLGRESRFTQSRLSRAASHFAARPVQVREQSDG